MHVTESVKHLKKKSLLTIVLHIEDHEKAALVGPNGAGKSTILKMIVGELPTDSGNIILTRGKTLGYLAQHQNMDSSNSIYDEVKSAKAHLIAMEEQLRSIELEMKDLSGSELASRIGDLQPLNRSL